jgi:hypothetical protein
LALFASTESDKFASISTDNKSSENAFRSALEEMKKEGHLNPVIIAALRLASARKDPELTRGLADYSNNYIGKNCFKRVVARVSDRIIQEVSFKTATNI